MSDKKRVLIVEDNEDVRRGLAIILGREFEVACAEDGITAMMAARRVRPHVIVLDLGLPGGDGLEVLKRLQEVPELAHTPTFVVTGRDGPEVERQALTSGAARVFRKPADPRELLEVIREAADCEPVKHQRVLIVEDDADTREAYATRLRAHDYTVSCVGDGATAVMQARSQEPDLVLLDLTLPCGDGLEVLERMRSIEGLEDLPVIVISGRDVEDACSEAVTAGANAFLEKPTSGAELIQAVRALI